MGELVHGGAPEVDHVGRRHGGTLRQSGVVIFAVSPDASWSFDPGAIALIAIIGFVYVRRWRVVRAHDGSRAAPTWRLWTFVAGLAMFAVALVSPVDTLGHQILAMHMVQHVILIDIVPILLILGLTKTLMRPVTRRLQPIENGPLGTPWSR